MTLAPLKNGLWRLQTRLLSRSVVRQQSAVEELQSSARPAIPSHLTGKALQRTLIPSSLPHERLHNAELDRLRVVPSLRTFYGGNPVHEENLNMLNALIRKHVNLPTKVVDDKEIQQNRLLSFEEYRSRILLGTRVKSIHHKELTLLLQRLRSIDPQLMPTEVTEVLQQFRSLSNELAKAAQQKLKSLDEHGRALSVGKRKRSAAKVYLVKGEGQVLVNGKSLTEYFPKDTDRRKIAYPFQVVGQEGQFNVFAETYGGGISGQVEAVMYGIAKSLVVFNPLFKSRLHKSGLMTRDARKVERKKPGKVKARKAPTWVKR